jgi:hypothetical protein
MKLIKKLKNKYRHWRDNRKLVKAKKLIVSVFKNELPGTIMRQNGQDVVVMDIQFSLKHNYVKSVKSKVKHHFTRKQRGVIYKHINEVKKINETIG